MAGTAAAALLRAYCSSHGRQLALVFRRASSSGLDAKVGLSLGCAVENASSAVRLCWPLQAGTELQATVSLNASITCERRAAYSNCSTALAVSSMQTSPASTCVQGTGASQGDAPPFNPVT